MFTQINIHTASKEFSKNSERVPTEFLKNPPQNPKNSRIPKNHPPCLQTTWKYLTRADRTKSLSSLIDPWKNKQTLLKSSTLYNLGPNFQYCQPTQKQPKYHIMFHKNGSPRHFYLMTLVRLLQLEALNFPHRLTNLEKHTSMDNFVIPIYLARFINLKLYITDWLWYDVRNEKLPTPFD